jgi:hypothetical protein
MHTVLGQIHSRTEDKDFTWIKGLDFFVASINHGEEILDDKFQELGISVDRTSLRSWQVEDRPEDLNFGTFSPKR